MSDAFDPSRCPLCGEENACGVAAGKDACWCMDATIPPEVLGSVPPGARDAACVCERCATATSTRPGAVRGTTAREVERRPLRVR